MLETLTGRAPAKINLVLEVLGRRPDGYHEIDTVLQELELADEVSLAQSSSMSLTATGAFAKGTPTDSSNLAWRAFELAAELCGFGGSAHISLVKNIAAAGGLGGGASDAACILRLCRNWMPTLTDADQLAIANTIGSDEAFFLAGGTARATGRGEVVTPLPPLPPHDVVLFVPQGTLDRKTARMFAAIGRTPFDTGRVAKGFAADPPDRITSADIHNAFERVAFDLFPALGVLWEDLERRIGEPVRLAGAGPTLFWIGPPGAGAGVATAANGSTCAIIQTRTVTGP